MSSVIPHSRPLLGDPERKAVLATLERAWVGAGGETSERFGRELAAYLHRPSALPVSSGTAALEIALRIVGVNGSAVAIPALCCASIERSVIRAGGVPHLVDVDVGDLSFSPGAMESLSRSCVALVLVHQFGIPSTSAPETVDLPIAVVEDATTSIGGMVAGRSVGTFGRCAVVSLAATKMLCAGEGGAIVGQTADIDRAREWANPESSLPPDEPVGHAKLSAMSCALGSAQLRRLPAFLARRVQIASYYDEILGDRSERVVRPRLGDTGTWWRYLVMVAPGAAQEVVERARARGVAFARPVAERRWKTRGRFPMSDNLHSRLVSVPIYPALNDSQVERVGEVMGQVLTAL